MFWARALADVIVVFHGMYVAFVVFGLVAILVGLGLGWRWVRNFWFRIAHLTAIGIVVVESLARVPCPLTTWEKALRVRGGQGAYTGDFLAQCMHRLIFFQVEPWVPILAYCLFGAAVGLAFWFGPPSWPGWRRKVSQRGATHQ